MDDFADALLMVKAGHPELAGWWGKLLGGASGGGGSEGGGGGSDDDGGSKPFDQLTWDQVIASTKTGKYKSFNVGDMKELDLGSEGIVHMQIVGIDVDDLADGSGKAPLTFISKELLATKHRMNPALTPSEAPYDEGTGAIGGWGKCEMRSYLKTTIKPLIPHNVRNGIKEVTKYSNIYDTNGTWVLDNATIDDVWIPSSRETFGFAEIINNETLGCIYNGIFTDYESLKKSIVDQTVQTGWSLRTTGGMKVFLAVTQTGNRISAMSTAIKAFPLGFCL